MQRHLHFVRTGCCMDLDSQHTMYTVTSLMQDYTRSPATAGTANRSLLFLEHRIPMPELFTELRFSILREFWTQEIWLPLLGGDAPRLG